jgi:hypothetical protein
VSSSEPSSTTTISKLAYRWASSCSMQRPSTSPEFQQTTITDAKGSAAPGGGFGPAGSRGWLLIGAPG